MKVNELLLFAGKLCSFRVSLNKSAESCILHKMSLEDLNEMNSSPSQSNGDCKSNGGGVCFSDGEHPDETLLSSPTDSGASKIERYSFGWFGYRPKCLQNLLSAKWALFWMCWAGALQGIYLGVL